MVKNEKIAEGEFFKVRHEVLQQWHTGKDFSLEEAITYNKRAPVYKNYSKIMQQAKENDVTLMQSRCGAGLLNVQIDKLSDLQNEGCADLLQITGDRISNDASYESCERYISESRRFGRVSGNGFPAVNYGVPGCRQVFEALDRPLQAGNGLSDARLLSEVVYASGWTSLEGGGISSNISRVARAGLEKTIRDWQYCDRLAAVYEEAGIPINREPFTPLVGMMVPPSMSNAIAIIEALLAAEQGVKNITVGHNQCGNIVQDVAALRALECQCKEYLQAYGYDVFLTTVFHQWMDSFQTDEPQALAMVSMGALSGALAGATKVNVRVDRRLNGKTVKESTIHGIKATKMILNLLKEQRMPMSVSQINEMRIINAETQCILDKVLELGMGDFAIGAVKGFEEGVLDMPFSPSTLNLGKVLPARDNDGFVRYLDFGNVPFGGDIKDFNRDKLEERASIESRGVSFRMTMDDMHSVRRGKLIGRP